MPDIVFTCKASPGIKSVSYLLVCTFQLPRGGSATKICKKNERIV